MRARATPGGDRLYRWGNQCRQSRRRRAESRASRSSMSAAYPPANSRCSATMCSTVIRPWSAAPMLIAFTKAASAHLPMATGICGRPNSMPQVLRSGRSMRPACRSRRIMPECYRASTSLARCASALAVDGRCRSIRGASRRRRHHRDLDPHGRHPFPLRGTLDDRQV